MSTSLNDLTDSQKVQLTQISYLDINSEGVKEIKEHGMTVSELRSYLSQPDEWQFGNALLNTDWTKDAAQTVVGEEGALTDAELLTQLENEGLGDLRITDISNDSFSGFQAMAFEDSNRNVGVSFRGSDADWTKGGANDWIFADVGEYFSGDSRQRQEALDFFDKVKNEDGNNYVYGHSLGGNLTSHTFLENHEQIQEAFTINGLAIDQSELDTPEKIAAFNSDKYNCNIICGDLVGNFKNYSLYENNVHFIQNNGEMPRNFASAHLVQAASCDENGNFKRTNRQEMEQEMGLGVRAVSNAAQFVRDTLSKIQHTYENARNEIEHAIDRVVPEKAKDFVDQAGKIIEEAVPAEWKEKAFDAKQKISDFGDSVKIKFEQTMVHDRETRIGIAENVIGAVKDFGDSIRNGFEQVEPTTDDFAMDGPMFNPTSKQQEQQSSMDLSKEINVNELDQDMIYAQVDIAQRFQEIKDREDVMGKGSGEISIDSLFSDSAPMSSLEEIDLGDIFQDNDMEYGFEDIGICDIDFGDCEPNLER